MRSIAKPRRLLMSLALAACTLTAAAQTKTVTHEIKRGETIESIARSYGTTVEAIKQANPNAGDYFFAGMKIQVPVGETAGRPAPQPVEKESTSPAVVRPVQTDRAQVAEQKHSNVFVTKAPKAGLWKSAQTTVGVGAWFYDGMQNYGLYLSYYTINGWALNMNFRSSFKKYGNYNLDLALLGYSARVWGNGDADLLVSAVAGPSLRSNKVVDGVNKATGELKEDFKMFVDAYIAASVMLRYKKITVTAGYDVWGLQFKFSKGNRGNGFYAAVGYNI